MDFRQTEYEMHNYNMSGVGLISKSIHTKCYIPFANEVGRGDKNLLKKDCSLKIKVKYDVHNFRCKQKSVKGFKTPRCNGLEMYSSTNSAEQKNRKNTEIDVNQKTF